MNLNEYSLLTKEAKTDIRRMLDLEDGSGSGGKGGIVPDYVITLEYDDNYNLFPTEVIGVPLYEFHTDKKIPVVAYKIDYEYDYYIGFLSCANADNNGQSILASGILLGTTFYRFTIMDNNGRPYIFQYSYQPLAVARGTLPITISSDSAVLYDNYYLPSNLQVENQLTYPDAVINFDDGTVINAQVEACYTDSSTKTLHITFIRYTDNDTCTVYRITAVDNKNDDWTLTMQTKSLT